MNLLQTKALVVFAAAGMVVGANATFRTVTVNNPPQNNAGGKINSVTATTTGTEFSWYANFSNNPSGKMTNGYWVVVSPGANPKGHAGELAIFYMDASGATPTLTAYAYNGQNGNSSWAVPGDKILSSKRASDLPDILDLTNQTESNGSKTIGFKIKSAKVNNFVPANPGSTPWTGANFGNEIGIWFHPVVELSSGYNSSGFLTKWNYKAEGWYDAEHVKTVPEPATLGALALGAAVVLRRRKK
ncbi:MAG: PEP-CTERM sorting domain-containing protein [Chthonomonas sp.]|nr:PEP-CTERM sorting domain-containing protein [Chthonomonas sp.]